MLLELSTQIAEPEEVCNPEMTMVESASVVKVTSLLESGVKAEAPKAEKVLPAATVRALLTVVVPVVAPRERVVAAPPTDRLVTLGLNRVAVVVVEVRSALEAPLMARSPPAVTLPVRVEVPSTVR